MLLKNYKNNAFTLIELLVAIAVFMILFMIILAFINLATGATKSAHTKLLTTDMRNIFNTLNIRINNATSKANLPDSIPIYGFAIYDIPSKSPVEKGLVITAGDAQEECYWIALNKTTSILKVQRQECNSKLLSPYEDGDMKNAFTSTKIKVTSFDLHEPEAVIMTSQNQTEAPYIKITIEAQDSDPQFADNIMTMQTSYTMDYLTVKELSK